MFFEKYITEVNFKTIPGVPHQVTAHIPKCVCVHTHTQTQMYTYTHTHTYTWIYKNLISV